MWKSSQHPLILNLLSGYPPMENDICIFPHIANFDTGNYIHPGVIQYIFGQMFVDTRQSSTQLYRMSVYAEALQFPLTGTRRTKPVPA